MDKPFVFISHITQEAHLAELFKEQIGQDFLGMIEVFVSSDGASISVGSKWLNDIDAALKNAKVEPILFGSIFACELFPWFSEPFAAQVRAGPLERGRQGAISRWSGG